MSTFTTGTHEIVRCEHCIAAAAQHVLTSGITPITRWQLPMPCTTGFAGARYTACQVCGAVEHAELMHRTPIRRGTCQSAGGAPAPARAASRAEQPGITLSQWLQQAEAHAQPVVLGIPTCTCLQCGHVVRARDLRVIPADGDLRPEPFGVGLCDICGSELPLPEWGSASDV